MTEREDGPSDKLVTSPSADQGWEPDDTWPPVELWGPGDQWQPGGEWEWVEPPYDDPGRPATAPPPPWYRRPGVLVGLIIAAMVTLVVASVVLLTNARFGESEDMRLRPTIHTSAVTVPSGAGRTGTSAPSTSATSTEPTRSTSPTEGPGPVGQPEPAPAAPPARGPVGAQSQAPATQEGPRINVTRNPMSFTPGG